MLAILTSDRNWVKLGEFDLNAFGFKLVESDLRHQTRGVWLIGDQTEVLGVGIRQFW